MSTHDINNFSDLLATFDEKALADGIGAKAHQPRDWRLRNSIPAEWWEPFTTYAAQIGRKEIDATLLASLAHRRRSVTAAQERNSAYVQDPQ